MMMMMMMTSEAKGIRQTETQRPGGIVSRTTWNV